MKYHPQCARQISDVWASTRLIVVPEWHHHGHGKEMAPANRSPRPSQQVGSFVVVSTWPVENTWKGLVGTHPLSPPPCSASLSLAKLCVATYFCGTGNKLVLLSLHSRVVLQLQNQKLVPLDCVVLGVDDRSNIESRTPRNKKDCRCF